MRDRQTFDVWIEKASDGELMWGRDDDREPRVLETRWRHSARSDLEELLIERLTGGWRRERDPAREIDVDDEPRNAELEAALAADLDDHAAALVYADWYQQRQHPRGDLIAIQCARARRPDDEELRRAERELLETWSDHLLGPLAKARASYHLGFELDWHNGFVRAARIDGRDYSPAGGELLWELLRHPSARFLRELVIGCHAFGDQDNRLTTALLLHAGPTPPLRKLVLADFDDTASDAIDISRAWLGDLTGLSDRYPLLEDVVFKGRGAGARDNALAHAGLRGLSLPRARRFAWRTSGMMRDTLLAILDAPWPELVELELWFGTGEYGCECSATDLASLVPERFPKLRVLRLMNAELSDELCPLVLDFVRRHPLEVIDFSLGTLSDDGAATLIANRAALAELRSLYVHDNCLTPAGLQRLREAGLPLIETAPFPGEGWIQSDYNRTNGQKNERYVSVSE